MRNRRWRAQAGPRRSVVAVVGGAVLAGALLLGPWLVLASPEPPPAEVSAPAGSPGASSGGAAVLTLTEALARARASGPGFAAAALLALDDAAFALELTAAALEQAETNLMLVERRLELGFAAPLERAEAELARLQARRDVLRAEANWHLRWLDVARRLGVPLP